MLLGLGVLEAGDAPDSTVIVEPVRDDVRLGKDLAAFDMKTWRIVAKFWNQPETSLDMVNDHIAEHEERVLGVLRSFGVTECRLDEHGGWIIGNGDAERERIFIDAYTKRVAKIETIKKGLVEDPVMSRVALEVVRRERVFRQHICDTIMDGENTSPESVDS